jgi:hypothetical protein
MRRGDPGSSHFPHGITTPWDGLGGAANGVLSTATGAITTGPPRHPAGVEHPWSAARATCDSGRVMLDGCKRVLRVPAGGTQSPAISAHTSLQRAVH